MIDIDSWTITRAVLEAQAAAPNPRLREIMDSLVRHHAAWPWAPFVSHITTGTARYVSAVSPAARASQLD